MAQQQVWLQPPPEPVEPPGPAPAAPRELDIPDEKSTSQMLAENSELNDCLFLVNNNVPFDVAFTLPPDERLAWVVIIGQLKGNRFNWRTMSWDPLR